MEKVKHRDQDWKIKVNIAKSVASQPQPSLMKFYQAFGEEFGTRPPDDLVEYFKDLLKSSEYTEKSKEDQIKEFVQTATAQSLSVLKFREVYFERFREKPSLECVEEFIAGLSKPDAKQTFGPIDPVQLLIDQVATQKNMTVLEFRQLFKQKLGRKPSADHVQLFIDRLSKFRSQIDPEPRKVKPQVQHEKQLEKTGRALGKPVLKGGPRTLFDGITNSAILTTDPSGMITVCNATAERFLGIERSAVVRKKNILSLLDPHDLEVYYSQLSLEVNVATDGFAAFVKKVEPNAPLTREWKFLGRDGKKIPLEITMSVLPETLNQKGGYLFELCDRRELNEARRKLYEMREQRQAHIVERENLILAISRKVLDPVTAIKGFSELLSDEVDMKLRRYTEIISGNADTITRILADYVVSHTIREGDFELETTPFNPHDLIDEAIRYNSCWLGSKSVEFEIFAEEEISSLLLGDRAAVQHILTSIIGHAADLPGAFKIDAQIQLNDERANQGQLLFVLTVQGGVMLPDDVEGVFTSGDDLLANSSLNHAIPLLSPGVCKQLARMMGGNIQIRVVAENQVEYRFSANVGVEQALVEGGGSPLRVLVAENDPVIFRLMDEILTEQGHKLTWARSGQQVVDVFLNAPTEYDLILMDVGMPEKGGVVATKEIRNAGHTATPIVALTACNSPGDSERFLVAGMSGYIEKPFTKEILLNAMIKWQPQ